MPPPDKLSAIHAVTADLLNKAAGLRAVNQPQERAIPHVLHDTLVYVRANLDRLEVVLGQAMDLKHATAMEARRQEQAEQDAWDDEADKARKQGRGEYEGAQERYAYWRLKTRDQRALARQAREEADVAADCEAKVRLMYRGLDSARQDLHARLRAVAFESALERT